MYKRNSICLLRCFVLSKNKSDTNKRMSLVLIYHSFSCIYLVRYQHHYNHLAQITVIIHLWEYKMYINDLFNSIIIAIYETHMKRLHSEKHIKLFWIKVECFNNSNEFFCGLFFRINSERRRVSICYGRSSLRCNLTITLLNSSPWNAFDQRITRLCVKYDNTFFDNTTDKTI